MPVEPNAYVVVEHIPLEGDFVRAVCLNPEDAELVAATWPISVDAQVRKVPLILTARAASPAEPADPLACEHDQDFPCGECGEGELLDRIADRLERTVES